MMQLFSEERATLRASFFGCTFNEKVYNASLMNNKINKPTIRDIKEILNDNTIAGYNDKRKNGRRIKLLRRISRRKRQTLKKELSIRFPNFKISCNDWMWRYWCRNIPTTAIHFNYKN